MVSKKLKTVFFLSFGVWLVLLGLWTYQSYHPQVSLVTVADCPSQNSSPGFRRLDVHLL